MVNNNNNSMTGDHETPDTPNLYNTLSQASQSQSFD